MLGSLEARSHGQRNGANILMQVFFAEDKVTSDEGIGHETWASPVR